MTPCSKLMKLQLSPTNHLIFTERCFRGSIKHLLLRNEFVIISFPDLNGECVLVALALYIAFLVLNFMFKLLNVLFCIIFSELFIIKVHSKCDLLVV